MENVYKNQNQNQNLKQISNIKYQILKMTNNQNQDLFNQAKNHIPAGVNSPVRAFAAVGGIPPFIRNGNGAKITDENNKTYTDYVGSWGPMILGHCHPKVIDAVKIAAENGLSFGTPTKNEVLLADLLCQLVPSMEMLRLVSSGTEATMSAIRLARGYTQRDLLVKFEGCYHGHSDSLLVKAGSGLLTFGDGKSSPSSAGVPEDIAKNTIVLPYNNIDVLQDFFLQNGNKVAAVIVELIAGNMNLIRPAADFIHKIRELTTKFGAIFIADEVMTGFRVGIKSAQGLFDVVPDLSTFGKVIGGGMPLAAFGGKKEIMQKIAPLGAVYQAGTLSGNPVATAAGLATLNEIKNTPNFYENLTQKTQMLVDGLQQAAKNAGYQHFTAQNVGGMFGIYFAENGKIPNDFAEISASVRIDDFNKFFHKMLDLGEYFAPSAYEAGFVSAAHSQEIIKQTIKNAEIAFKALKA